MTAAADAGPVFRMDRHEQPARVKVRATRDYWVIPDCIAGRAGVFNDAYRPAEELERSYATLEGKPITIHHPPEDDVHHGLLAVFPDEIHGVVRNARWDASGQEVRYDAYLFRRVDVPGHQTILSVVETNESIVNALEDGVELDNSPGYMTRVERVRGEHGGKPFNEIRRDFGYWHLAIVPRGACGWDDHCGLGRGQDDETSTGRDEMTKTELEQLKAEVDRLTQCAKKADEREADVKKALDDARAQGKRLEDELKALRTTRRADNREDPDPKPDPMVAALQKQVDDLKEAHKRAEDERKTAQDHLLAKKRDELAKLRGLKADAAKALDSYTLPALEDAIQREQALRAHADNMGFLPSGEADAAAGAPAMGPTVGRWDAKEGKFVDA